MRTPAAIGAREMGSQFPKLFRQYYLIHETIHAALSESNGGPIEITEIERRVRETHPDLSMKPTTLADAIKQAAKDAGAMLRD